MNKDLRQITWSNIHNATVLDTITSSFFYDLKPKTFTDMISLTICLKQVLKELLPSLYLNE